MFFCLHIFTLAPDPTREVPAPQHWTGLGLSSLKKGDPTLVLANN